MPYAKPSVRASSWSAKDYETRLTELRTEFGELREADRTTDAYRTSHEALLQERADLDSEYRTVRLLENAEPETRATAGFSMSTPEHREALSAGEFVIADERFADWISRGHQGESPTVSMRGRFADQWKQEWQPGYEMRTLVDGTGGTNLLIPVQQPEFPVQTFERKRLWLRDILAGGSTSSNAVPYLLELNATANETSASTVAPGELKPEATIEFQDELAPVRTIAVTIPATNQMFDDAPALVSYINTRLSYMLAVREEQQFLTGAGTGQDLKGILTYAGAGLQTQAATAGEAAITIANAIAKVQVVNGYPTAVAMNPVDYWAMVTKRAAGGSGTFDAGAPFSATPFTVWGLPIVVTNGITAGKALVGDFRLGAQYFDRSSTEVRTFEQHSDYARRNLRLVRAEERLALAVYRPDWYVDTSLS